jgi:hypothetical protein
MQLSRRGGWLPRISGWLLAGAVAAVAVVAVIPLFFAQPLGDDFCNALNVREHGFAGAWLREYLGWGGRWAGTVVACGFPALVDPVTGYAGALLVVQAAVFAGFYGLLRVLLPEPDERRPALAAAALLHALLWTGMPHPGQTVYWLEGAIVYSLDVSLWLLLVAWLLRAPRAPAGRARLALGLGGALVIGAFHELFALVFGALAGVGAVVALRLRDPRWRAWAAVALGAALALASVVLAPGNEARIAVVNPEPPGAGRVLALTVLTWVRILDAPLARGGAIGQLTALDWVAEPKLLAATLLLATWPRLRRLRPGAPGPDAGFLRALAPALLVAALTGAFFAGAQAAGRPLPLRALNGLYAVFLVGWLGTAVLWLRPGLPEGPATASLRGLAHAVLALALVTSTNFKLAVRDLAEGRLVAFERAMEARREAARELAARGDGNTLEIRPVTPWPATYFRSDLPDIAPELRQCWVRWSGLAGIRTGDPAERPEGLVSKD